MVRAAISRARSAVVLGALGAGLAALGAAVVDCNVILGVNDYGVCGASGAKCTVSADCCAGVCASGVCSAPCPAPGLVDWYAPKCSACVKAHCCDAATACAGDAACAERQRCLHACTDPSCPLTCGVPIAASTGADTVATNGAIAALYACMSTSCSGDCDLGAQRGCVGQFSWPPAAPGQATLTLDTTVFSGTLNKLGAPVPALHLSACDAPSVCSPATTKETAPGTTVITVPSGFNGYLDIAPTSAESTLESLVYLTWPVVTDVTVDLRLLTEQYLFDVVVLLSHGSYDPTRGAIVVYTRDCLGYAASGMKLCLDTGSGGCSDAFYFQGGVPAPVVQNTGSGGGGGSDGGFACVHPPLPPEPTTATDSVAGWVDVLPGNATITAMQDGAVVAQQTVVVASKGVTYVWLTPTPSAANASPCPQ